MVKGWRLTSARAMHFSQSPHEHRIEELVTGSRARDHRADGIVRPVFGLRMLEVEKPQASAMS